MSTINPFQAINYAEQQYGLAPGLLNSVWQQESSGSTDLGLQGPSTRHGRAVGPFQIMPSIWGQPPQSFGDQALLAASILARGGKTPQQQLAAYYGTGTAPPGQPTTDQYVNQVLGRMGQQMPTASFQSPVDAKQIQAQNQALANALLQQQLAQRQFAAASQQGMPQGQIVSGRYVAPSWTQQLSAALAGPLAAYQLKKASQAVQSAQGTASQAKANALAGALGGGNSNAAALITSGDPALKSAGLAMLTAQLQGQAPVTAYQQAQLGQGQQGLALKQQQLAQQAAQSARDYYDKTGQMPPGMAPVQTMPYQAPGAGTQPLPQLAPPTQMPPQMPPEPPMQLPKPIATVQNGQPAVPPSVQRQLMVAQGKAGIANQQAAQQQLKSVAPLAESTIQNIDAVLKNPALSEVTGFSPRGWIKARIPGTKEHDLAARMEQLHGQSFLQAYNLLRGGGQITEIEGKKAENAISRLDTAQSYKEYKNALQDFKGIIQTGLNRVQSAAGVKESSNSGPSQLPTNQSGQIIRSQLTEGQTYQTPAGPQVWNGNSFEAQ